MADQQKSIQKPSPDSSSDILDPVAEAPASEPRQRAAGRAEDDTRYNPTPVEQKWAALWESDLARYAPEAALLRQAQVLRRGDAALSLAAHCTWATCATTPLVTPSPATCG